MGEKVDTARNETQQQTTRGRKIDTRKQILFKQGKYLWDPPIEAAHA